MKLNPKAAVAVEARSSIQLNFALRGAVGGRSPGIYGTSYRRQSFDGERDTYLS